MWIAFSAAAVMAACSVAYSARDEGPGALADGGLQEAKVDLPAADGASDPVDGGDPDSAPPDGAPDVVVAPTNLLANGDFSEGCASTWRTNAVVVMDDTTARSAPVACRVCGMGASGSWSLFQILDLKSSAAGLKYRADAWLRAPASGSAATVSCLIEVFDAAHKRVQVSVSPVALMSGVWSKCSADLTVSAVAAATAKTLEVSIVGSPVGACLLVDDASLALLP